MIPTPSRRRGVERLDEPGVDSALRLRSLADIARANRLFGGRSAVVAEAIIVLPRLGPHVTLLDVGTGLGDIPAAVAAAAGRHGIRVTTIGVDLAPELAIASRTAGGHGVCADAFRLPFADASVDMVTCSQLLHHFPEAEGRTLLQELHRVARHRVIVGDLRRSWIAAGGFWLATFPLRFHPATRHDGTLSVLRGFTATELTTLVRQAVGLTPEVRRRPGWRLTAAWTPIRSPLPAAGTR